MTVDHVSPYILPQQWARYHITTIAGLLVEARTAAGVLARLPYLHQWIEQVHEEQLRLEAAGTSRIEGADFTPQEQAEALAPDAHERVGLTHSQRQLRAADSTYRWLRSLPAARPVTAELIRDVHRHIVTGCDDDHCQPGALRSAGSNVTFGMPVCRGAEGGIELDGAFGAFCEALTGELRGHDRIIQSVAAHYHIGAMHPFSDGNGRTARAVEAFMLREAGVNNMVMVSLSNYYYEHQGEYRASLHESRERGHDLTPFLTFALPAIADRCNALAEEIATQNKQVLYRQFAHSLFGRLRSPRRRALADRQLQIMDIVLDLSPTNLQEQVNRASVHYGGLKYPARALLRDLNELLALSAVDFREGRLLANLDWPQQFSASDLLAQYANMPASASVSHPAIAELSRLLHSQR